MKNGNRDAYPVPDDGFGGLTKRELFASMAMQGMLSADDSGLAPKTVEDAFLAGGEDAARAAWATHCAGLAVVHADAPLAALEGSDVE